VVEDTNPMVEAEVVTEVEVKEEAIEREVSLRVTMMRSSMKRRNLRLRDKTRRRISMWIRTAILIYESAETHNFSLLILLQKIFLECFK